MRHRLVTRARPGALLALGALVACGGDPNMRLTDAMMQGGDSAITLDAATTDVSLPEATVPAPDALPDAPPDAPRLLDLRHCWGGENSGMDSVGGAHATVGADVGFGPGKSGSAFVCRGAMVQQDAVVSAPPMLAINSAWTFELWINIAALPDTEAWVIDRAPMGLELPLVGLLLLASGEARWQVRYDDQPDAPYAYAFMPPRGRWVHIALVRFDSLYTWYVDGARIRAAARMGEDNRHLDFRAPVFCGHHQDTGNGFRGGLDSIRIWNRALSADDIARIARGDGSCTAE